MANSILMYVFTVRKVVCFQCKFWNGQKTWTGILQKRLYKWPINIWKNVHDTSPRKCKLYPHLFTTTCPTDWLTLMRATNIENWQVCGETGFSQTANGGVKWYLLINHWQYLLWLKLCTSYANTPRNIPLVGRINTLSFPKAVHLLILGNCDFIMFHGER